MYGFMICCFFEKMIKKNGKNDEKEKGRGGTVLMPVIRQIKFRKKQYV